jgi:hypothetical protein
MWNDDHFTDVSHTSCAERADGAPLWKVERWSQLDFERNARTPTKAIIKIRERLPAPIFAL